VIKNLDQRVLRELKAQAARRGLTLAQVFSEAAELWANRNEEAMLSTEVERNNEFYESNRAELERQYKRKYLLITDGHLNGAYESLDDVGQRLRSLSPRPKHAIITKVGEDLKESGEWLGGTLER
jgi:hypothetical protein